MVSSVHGAGSPPSFFNRTDSRSRIQYINRSHGDSFLTSSINTGFPLQGFVERVNRFDQLFQEVR